MEHINYAIVLYMNDEKTAMVKEWIKELALVCGSDYCLGTYNDIPVKISRSGSDKYCIEPDGVYFENPNAIDTLEKMDFVEYQMHWYKVVL